VVYTKLASPVTPDGVVVLRGCVGVTFRLALLLVVNID
jgi:hypothetical protein